MELYRDILKDISFKKLATDFKSFEHGLYGVNADYGPSWNGVQWGNDRASRNLAEFVVKLMEKNIKRMEDDEEEDDE